MDGDGSGERGRELWVPSVFGRELWVLVDGEKSQKALLDYCSPSCLKNPKERFGFPA